MIYVLTSEKLNRLKSQRQKESITCSRCFQEFKEGDKIVSRVTPSRRKHYHVECWESMFI